MIILFKIKTKIAKSQPNHAISSKQQTTRQIYCDVCLFCYSV